MLLVDPAHDYHYLIKGCDKLEAIIASGVASPLRALTVTVDSTTDDPERMVAAMQVIAMMNPTGRPPYVLPVDDEVEDR